MTLADRSEDAAVEDAVSPFEDSRFLPLDARTPTVWRLAIGVWAAVLLGGGLIPLAFLYFRAGAVTPFYLVGALWLLLAAQMLYQAVWYTPLAYRGWGYRLDGRVLEIRKGVWSRSLALLPLSRLQHVDIQRGPLERRFGLATLTLHTAGTQNATLTLPGLDADEAVRLRDRLLARLHADAEADDGV